MEEGLCPRIGIKKGERHEVDWYEDELGSIPSKQACAR